MRNYAENDPEILEAMGTRLLFRFVVKRRFISDGSAEADIKEAKEAVNRWTGARLKERERERREREEIDRGLFLC